MMHTESLSRSFQTQGPQTAKLHDPQVNILVQGSSTSPCVLVNEDNDGQ